MPIPNPMQIVGLRPLTLAAVLLIGACSGAGDPSAATSSTTTGATTAPTSSTIAPTTLAPTSTTTLASPVTTDPQPEFPEDLEDLTHGGETWAVVLAASEGFSDPLLVTAILAAQNAGYLTGPTDCDSGAADLLGLPAENHYYTVSVYFADESDAEAAKSAFAARGVGGTVGIVQTFCLD